MEFIQFGDGQLSYPTKIPIDLPEGQTYAETLWEWSHRKARPDVLGAIYDGAAQSESEGRKHRAAAHAERLWVLDRVARNLASNGPAVEMGVWKGDSAEVLARHFPELHLVDSFEGLSQPQVMDAITIGGGEFQVAQGAGGFETSVAAVSKRLPEARIHAGWIPGVLGKLPEREWAFVHCDLDLFEPSYAVIQWALDKLRPGGVLVCDDYVSLLFPGAGRAMRERLDTSQFSVLATGQAVHVKG